MIQPEHYYEFFINRQTDLLLPFPYSIDCVDHNQTKPDGSDYTKEYLHHPLSRGTSIIGSMAQNTMDKCNYWSPELSFMKGSVEGS